MLMQGHVPSNRGGIAPLQAIGKAKHCLRCPPHELSGQPCECTPENEYKFRTSRRKTGWCNLPKHAPLVRQEDHIAQSNPTDKLQISVGISQFRA